jgi:hypothetical protein
MKFDEFHLSDKYRKELDSLNKKRICDKVFERYSLEEIKNIFTYYEININEYVLSVAKKKFIDNPNPYFAYVFAKNFIKGRWKQAESIILKKPSVIYCYTRDIIKGRWEECEENLSKDVVYSYWYAKNILQGRFLKAEKLIKKDPLFSSSYARDILKKPWPQEKS